MTRASLDPQQLSHFGPLGLRIALGSVFLAHAYAKAALFTFAGTEQYFMAHGFPGWTVYPVFAAGVAGGLALLAGYRTRMVAVLMIPVMLGALKPHLGNGWMFTNSGGGWEYVAFILMALVSQTLLGAGAFALSERRSPAQPSAAGVERLDGPRVQHAA